MPEPTCNHTQQSGVCALRSVLARAEAVCEAAEKLHDYEKEGDGTDWDAHYEALYAALRAWRAGKEEK
jgi:hypothetical protein